jgi:hypothetical protein
LGQLLGAVLSIHVKYSPGESVGRLEDRIMHWISETSTQFTESQAAAASPARPAFSKVAAADVLWPMRAAFDRLNASAKLPSQQTSSWSPCEMFAIVFMFKAIPVLAIPDSSNSLTAPAMRSVRAFVLQYYDMCAAEGSSRKSIGSGPPTAGEGADALYLCLLSLLLQPGDAELLQRLGMSRLERHESDEAGAGDSEAPDAAPLHPPFDDVVVMLLSKLEPSGILDRCVIPRYLLSTLARSSPIDIIRWPAFMCALFLRFLDALIIGSQASLIMPHLISTTFDQWQQAVPPHLHSSSGNPPDPQQCGSSTLQNQKSRLSEVRWGCGHVAARDRLRRVGWSGWSGCGVQLRVRVGAVHHPAAACSLCGRRAQERIVVSAFHGVIVRNVHRLR